MLFKSLALKNFKCFEEVEVEFAPITLLTGANSSGKSSLIYSLLAMLQTEQFPLYLSPNGKYVDMGSFKEMVHQSDFSKEIEINLTLEYKFKEKLHFSLYPKNGAFNSIWSFDNKNSLPNIYRFNIEIGDKRYVLNRVSGDNYHFSFETSNFDELEIQYGVYDRGLDILKNNKFIKLGENISIKDELIAIRNIPLSSVQELKTVLSDIPDIPDGFSDSIFEYIEGYIHFIETRFNYLGSFRLPPERTYYQKAKAQDKVGVNGEGYIDQIIEWEETDPEKFKELNDILVELELVQSIQSEKMKGGRFELTVKTKANSATASLTDVGFGISQFLPLIVADLQLRDASCLTLSQPEIHLHPKIQALFGNYLAKKINKSSKQYIVETHSEYLLNRIRLLLVKGELKPEDVHVYYFENDGIKSIVHKVDFTTDGQIQGAPDGFFDTYGMDVMDIALNA